MLRVQRKLAESPQSAVAVCKQEPLTAVPLPPCFTVVERGEDHSEAGGDCSPVAGRRRKSSWETALASSNTTLMLV